MTDVERRRMANLVIAKYKPTTRCNACGGIGTDLTPDGEVPCGFCTDGRRPVVDVDLTTIDRVGRPSPDLWVLFCQHCECLDVMPENVGGFGVVHKELDVGGQGETATDAVLSLLVKA